jgi:hypothetical protein
MVQKEYCFRQMNAVSDEQCIVIEFFLHPGCHHKIAGILCNAITNWE